MMLRLATLVAACLLCSTGYAQEKTVLTLGEAFARVAGAHPELRLIDARGDGIATELERAAFRPPLVLGAEIENALGTGDASGLSAAEATFSLASVLERGGKLQARQALAQRRIDALAGEHEAKRLDLLAEVARRYLAAAAALHQQSIAERDIAQRQRTVTGAKQRLHAGASPESVVLTAQAALARAELEHARALQRHADARRHLAALWGERAPAFEVSATDPTRLPDIAGFDVLVQLLDRNPDLLRFASEQRIGEARLQLARSQGSADLDWEVGIRRLHATDGVALVAGISIPLGTRTRAQPDIRAAQAELVALEIEREAREWSLHSTLADAHGRYSVVKLEVERLRGDIIPKLVRAEQAAERAYRAGAISYLEWAQLQSDTTSARKQQLEAALDAHRALIEIQRLIGDPFIVATHATQETIP